MVKNKEIGVNQGCKLFNIAKQTYYDCKDPEERFLEKYKHLKKYIKKIIDENSFYGVKRVKAALELEYNITVGRDTLGKLLKLWELDLGRKVKKSKKSFIRKTLEKIGGKSNILIRTNVNSIFKSITSDITEIRYKAGKVYLCVHKDVYGQMVYGSCISRNMDKELVLSSFREATEYINKYCSEEDFREIIWHQDQGSQYTSYDYVNAVLKVGRISYSKKGTPVENGGQESFFGRLKVENRVDFMECETYDEIEALIEDRLEYYNQRRIHTSIDYKPPALFIEKYLKVV